MGKRTKIKEHDIEWPKLANYWQEYFPKDFNFKDEIIGNSYDALIVGGGIMGLSTARTLIESGFKVAIVDCGKVGGNSGRSGGIISDDNEKDFVEWIRELGETNARELLHFTRESAKDFLEFIEQNSLETPEKNGVIVVARTKNDLKTLADDIEAHRNFGLELEVLTEERLRYKLNSKVFKSGYFNKHTAAINPYRALRNFAYYLYKNGCQINEGLEVELVEGNIAITPNGKIIAKKIIITSGSAAGKLTRLKKHALPLTSFLIITAPLLAHEKEKIGWQGREILWDIGRVFSYFRFLPDDRIMYGPSSADIFGDWTQNQKKHYEVARRAEKDLADIFHISPSVEYVWSGIMHVTEDGLPDFGTFPTNSSVLYGVGASLALGFGIGKQLAEMAMDKPGSHSSFLAKLQRHYPGPYSLLFHVPLPQKFRMFLANRFLRFLG